MTIHVARDLRLVPIESLLPYENNARTHSDAQVDQIAASMREFGFTAPLLIDGSNGIIAGHGRLAAAKKLGMQHVPVIELGHLTPAQKRAYILADNRLAEEGRWDYDLLKEELAALDKFDFDLETIGFSDAELKNLLPDIELAADNILKANPEPQPAGSHEESEPGGEESDDTEEVRKEVIGAKEYGEHEFQAFAHKCPRCSFEFN